MRSAAPLYAQAGTVQTGSRDGAGSRLNGIGRLLLAAVALLALAPPIYLLQTGSALSTGYTIQNLEKERERWEIRNRQIETEIARARSLTWVEHEAVHRLGMQRPAEQIVIRVDAPMPPVQARQPRAQALPVTAPPDMTAEPRQRSWLDGVTGAMSRLIAGD